MAERASLPLVTVVLPVRNEAAFIVPTLGAVLAQDYPPDRLEILVVDGLSTDGTPEIVRALAAEDARIILLINPARIQAAALNRAVEVARGDVIVRVDGHTIIAPDYVRQSVHYLAASGADTVGGPLRSIGITPMGRAIAVAYRSPFGVPSRYRISRRAEYVDQVYMGAWPREVFTRVGLFDGTLAVNEDYEHNYRIRKAGGRVFLTPDIHSAYYGRQTLGELWLQYVRYGRGKMRVIARYPASTRLRHLVAPLFVLVLVLGGLFALLNAWAALGWCVVLVSYLLVNFAASIRAAQRGGWNLLPRLPAVFAVMHVGWGTGIWIECAHLIGRRLLRRS